MLPLLVKTALTIYQFCENRKQYLCKSFNVLFILIQVIGNNYIVIYCNMLLLYYQIVIYFAERYFF